MFSGGNEYGKEVGSKEACHSDNLDDCSRCTKFSGNVYTVPQCQAKCHSMKQCRRYSDGKPIRQSTITNQAGLFNITTDDDEKVYLCKQHKSSVMIAALEPCHPDSDAPCVTCDVAPIDTYRSCLWMCDRLSQCKRPGKYHGLCWQHFVCCVNEVLTNLLAQTRDRPILIGYETAEIPDSLEDTVVYLQHMVWSSWDQKWYSYDLIRREQLKEIPSVVEQLKKYRTTMRLIYISPIDMVNESTPMLNRMMLDNIIHPNHVVDGNIRNICIVRHDSYDFTQRGRYMMVPEPTLMRAIRPAYWADALIYICSNVNVEDFTMDDLIVWRSKTCLNPKYDEGTSHALQILCWTYLCFYHDDGKEPSFSLGKHVYVQGMETSPSLVDISAIEIDRKQRYTVWPTTLMWYKGRADARIHAISIVFDRDAPDSNGNGSLTLTHGDGYEYSAKKYAPILTLLQSCINGGKPTINPDSYPAEQHQIRYSDNACGAWSIITAMYFMNARDRFPDATSISYRPLRRFMTDFTMAFHQMELNPKEMKGIPLVESMLHYLAYFRVNFHFVWEEK
jgi:hypothetical protein